MGWAVETGGGVGEGDCTEVIVFALERLKVRAGGAGLPVNEGEGSGSGRIRPEAAAN